MAGAMVASILCLPSGWFFLTCMLGSRKLSHAMQAHAPPVARPRTVVLIPAHNEESNIARTLEALNSQLGPEDRILVVADNCQDETARIAESLGATVLRRFNEQFRGKGYALDHGIRHLLANPPEVVVMIDADCEMHPESLKHLSTCAHEQQRPQQATYLMLPPEDSALQMKVAAFAWLVKNQIRPAGVTALGGVNLLTGSGMAFPWRQIVEAPLASSNLVEDMQLGIDLAVRGAPPNYCAHALVTSQFPNNADGQKSQRLRWEQGHFSTLRSQVPRLLRQGVRQARPTLWALALDLAVPPLTSLIFLNMAVLLMSAMIALGVGSFGALKISTSSLMLITSAVIMVWYLRGRHLLSVAELASIPSYMTGKWRVYLTILRGADTGWIRTKRDHGQE
jgi:cellulose synthase/poly-beta-1,6-N-acetylglucosamine synthase-like glycosyltransferase